MVRLKSRMAACALLALSAVFLCAPHVGGQIPCSYTVEYLPTLPPCSPGWPNYIEPWDISPNGRYVCGNIDQCGPIYPRAVVVDTQTMQITYLPLPSGVLGLNARGVNDNMEVTGTMYMAPGGVERAFLSRDGLIVPIAPPPNDYISEALSINNKTEIVGYWSTSEGYQPFVWRDGVANALELPMPTGSAKCIGEDGRIVGFMGSSSPAAAVAFVWTAGKTTSLGVIPGGYSSAAMAIARNGTVAGYGSVAGGDYGYRRGFVWRNGSMSIVEPFAGYTESQVNDTNNWVSVGLCPIWPNPGADSAFQYANGLVRRLDSMQSNTNLWIYSGRAISDGGSVAAVAKLGSAHVRVVLRPAFGPTGDANGSCTVDVQDLLLVINQWGMSNSSADVNNDGIVNVSDLLLIIQNWTG